MMDVQEPTPPKEGWLSTTIGILIFVLLIGTPAGRHLLDQALKACVIAVSRWG